MNPAKLKSGMEVDCLGTRLGTIRRVRGRGTARVLEVERAGRPPLEIPVQYAVQVLGNRVLLDAGCAEAAATTWQAAAPATGSAPGAGLTELPPGQSLTVPVVEEVLVPATHWQEAGAVEVRKGVRITTRELDVPVRYEEATVDRVPVNRVLAEGETPLPREEGATWIVPVIQEEVVVQKRRVLVEEVRITRQVRTTTRHIAEPVRREEVEVSYPGLEATTEPAPPPDA